MSWREYLVTSVELMEIGWNMVSLEHWQLQVFSR